MTSSGIVKTAAVSVPSIVSGPGATAATNGVTSKLLARVWLTIGSRPTIVTRSARDADLFAQLAQRGPAQVAAVGGIDRAAGQRDLAGMVAQVRGALDEDHAVRRRGQDRERRPRRCAAVRSRRLSSPPHRAPRFRRDERRSSAGRFAGGLAKDRTGVIDFFLHRPVFASVCALFIVLAGLISIPTLPVAQFPQVAPPVVTVTTQYIGANAQAAEASVTTPLEEAINGVDGLRYISSTTTSDGTSTIACTFFLDRDIDLAANDVQNAGQQHDRPAAGRGRATGITVTKNSGTFVIAHGAWRRPTRATTASSSATTRPTTSSTCSSVSAASTTCASSASARYAMRLWLDPTRLNLNHVTATDVVNALSDAERRRSPRARSARRRSAPTSPTRSRSARSGGLRTPEQFGEPDPAREPGRRLRASARRRAGRARRGELRPGPASDGTRRDRHRGAHPAQRQRAAGRRATCARTMDRLSERLPAGHHLQGRLRRDAVRERVDPRGAQDAGDLDRAGRSRSCSCSCRAGARR